MIAPQSRLCLSVETFFSRFNWRGRSSEHLGTQASDDLAALLKTPNEPTEVSSLAPALTSLTLPVGQLFQSIPWEGYLEAAQPPKSKSELKPISIDQAESTPASAKPKISGMREPESLLRCSVREFFGDYNWQGKSLENLKRQPYSTEESSSSPGWMNGSLSVEKFFQFIPWDGHPEVGSLPRSSSRFQIESQNPPEMTLADISELF